MNGQEKSGLIRSISEKLPSVVKPAFRLTFRDKLKWTVIILILYFILGSITVYGVNQNAILRFEFLEIIFGSKFGSLITLGIGPIVTASIILQMLVGSKILNWNLQKEEDKAKFTGTQKILSILFCFFEAVAYVVAGAIPPAQPYLLPIVILQLAAGGIIVMFMDEVCSKWGFGSGISLFIAAGVSKTLLVAAISPLDSAGKLFFLSGADASSVTGIIWKFFVALAGGNPLLAIFSFLPLLSVAVVFFIVVYAQAMEIEIPMAFSMPFGSFARRWPLKFIYTSNIPVILTAAVLANLQIVGKILSERGVTFFGVYENGQLSCANPGLMCFLTTPQSSGIIVVLLLSGAMGLLFALLGSYYVKKNPVKFLFFGSILGLLLGLSIVLFVGSIPGVPLSISFIDIARAASYLAVMILGSVVFSIFWVSTAGMDAKSVAQQFESSNLLIPGFRRDPRVIERVLEKYIPTLAVLGGAFVGFLAGFADLTGAIGTGTGILLTVMIVYQMYQQITTQHFEDMHPAVRKFIEG